MDLFGIKIRERVLGELAEYKRKDIFTESLYDFFLKKRVFAWLKKG